MTMPKLLHGTRNLALFTVVILVLWVVLMILSGMQMQADWAAKDYLNYAREQNPVFVLNYLNAGLFTALVIVLFGCLYLLVKNEYPVLALVGLLFIPVYGTLNLLVYLGQVTILPLVANGSASQEAALQWMQLYPGSPIGMVNGLAYALLGISSVLYALTIIGRGKMGQITAWLLIVNTVLCLLGPIGVMTGNSLLTLGTVAGGIVFTGAVFTLYLMLKAELKSASI